jgi:hypothetical protein
MRAVKHCWYGYFVKGCCIKQLQPRIFVVWLWQLFAGCAQVGMERVSQSLRMHAMQQDSCLWKAGAAVSFMACTAFCVVPTDILTRHNLVMA